jgi:hypothetical protein
LTTAFSGSICSSFSPVPRPTYHSMSTGAPTVADWVAGGDVGVADVGPWEAAGVHAAATIARDAKKAAKRRTLRVASIDLVLL